MPMGRILNAMERIRNAMERIRNAMERIRNANGEECKCQWGGL